MGLAALAVWAEQTRLGKAVSAPAIIIVVAMVGSTFGVLPASAPLYDAVWTYAVPLSIALFLIKADLLDIAKRSGPMLAAFLVGTVGASIGALLPAVLFDLGPDEAKLAGVFAATYTGGSLNFAGVAQAIGFDDPSKLSAALAVDNVLGTAYILGANLLAGWSLFRSRFYWGSESICEQGEAAETTADDRQPSLLDLVVSIALAASVCAGSAAIARVFGFESYALLFLTVLMVALATGLRQHLRDLRGESVLAMGLMFLFFGVIGAGANLADMATSAPTIFVLGLSIFIFHLIFLLGAARLFRWNYGIVIVSSLACIAGPPVAAAIAVLFGWRALVTPGILTGVLGYVLGNFIGVGIYQLLA
ncbi:MAG: DUF819 family protein [Pseudomonadota bacterium]